MSLSPSFADERKNMDPNPITPPPSKPCSPKTPAPAAESSTISNVKEKFFNDTAVTDGSLTVVDEDGPERDPESLEKPRYSRSLSHYLRRISTASVLSKIPTVWKPSEKDAENDDPDRIDAHPLGYPRLAAFLNSDENFLLCRKYGFLHNRVLLYRQDELRELESQLLDLDAEDEELDKRALRSRTRDDKREGSLRKALIQEIDDKLKEYDDIALRTRAMNALPKATPRNYTSVDNWIHNNGPLCGPEAKFIKNDKDFVALTDPREGSWFDGVVEDVLSKIPCKLTRVFFIEPRARRSTEEHLVRLWSKSRIDTFVRLIITFLAVVLLMAPVVVLFEGTSSGPVKIIIILVFTLFFSAALSIFTRAKRHEVFAATAA
ncbi:hypothetical protein AOQ84DRAFT_386949 [Glonium stellatum]|uniref:DUF6594 domain-containing protein n=1 Tax=Glonium stellatum TaxID=574774 RepID=A0A8E2F7A4_9PEZI|nr:hypothetical protein AOQ84DRAFT_386949 [Glonium stellatum]